MIALADSPIPYPKGSQFQHKRSKQAWTLVAASSEEATLNQEVEGGVISSRFTWQQVDRLFSPILHAPTTPSGNPDRSGNPRRRRRTTRNQHSAASGENQQHSADRSQDVLSPQSPSALEAGTRSKGVSVESAPAEGDLIPGNAGDDSLPVVIDSAAASITSYPLERDAIHAEATHDAIALLEQERDRLKAEGAIAPDGCWIETGKVKGRNFRQAWWRASKPTFTPKRSKGNVEAKVKTQYIGEEGSPEHKQAIAERDRRDALKRIERQIQVLMEDCER